MVAGLPDELWHLIFSYLDWETLDRSIPDVCKAFRTLVFWTPGAHVEINDTERYKLYHIVGSATMLRNTRREDLAPTVAKWRKTLRHFESRGFATLLNDMSPLSRSPYLTSLSGRIFSHNVSERNRLTRLEFDNVIVTDTQFIAVVERCPHLREMIIGPDTRELSDVGISRLANLTRFELRGVAPRIGDAGLRCMIVKSRLKRFVLTVRSPGITAATLTHLRKNPGPSLEHLEIGYKTPVSPLLIEAGGRLKTLRCILFNTVADALACGACPVLETLDIGPNLLTKRDMARVTAGCPMLRDISGGFFTDQMIEAIVHTYPSCTLRVRSPKQAAYSRWQGHPGLSLIEA